MDTRRDSEDMLVDGEYDVDSVIQKAIRDKETRTIR